MHLNLKIILSLSILLDFIIVSPRPRSLVCLPVWISKPCFSVEPPGPSSSVIGHHIARNFLILISNMVLSRSWGPLYVRKSFLFGIDGSKFDVFILAGEILAISIGVVSFNSLRCFLFNISRFNSIFILHKSKQTSPGPGIADNWGGI